MSNRYEVIQGEVSHAYELSAHLKQADLDEISASSGKSSIDALLSGFGPNAKVWSFAKRGRVILMFGVNSGSATSPIGVPWLLGSELGRLDRLAVLSRSRQYVEEMRKGYLVLENWTDKRHRESHNWLRWMGFTLESPLPWGVRGLPFNRFWMPGYV